MDHYPWKNKKTLVLFRDSPERIQSIHNVFKEEIDRKTANNGTIIIPLVTLNGLDFTAQFSDVAVAPHNLRNDLFQDNVTTAIDVILSLGDQGLITYELKWYDAIGRADPVGNYWVEAINDNVVSGGCGFVYESGDNSFTGFTGNHIHLPSDSRIINSPEYVQYFWICL